MEIRVLLLAAVVACGLLAPAALLHAEEVAIRKPAVSKCTTTEPATFVNPIAEGADPWVIPYGDSYLLCASERSRGIALYESKRLTEIGPKRVIWTAPSTGPFSQEIWAPEMHLIDGRWYIYFAASNGENRNHRTYVLESADDDAYGPYTLKGPIYTGDDAIGRTNNRWAIDATVLQIRGIRYLVWSGWEDDSDVQYLYIARLKSPSETATARVKICKNDSYLWERVDENLSGRGLMEGPEVLKHSGRTFIAYSCSGSWQPSYKLGLLELRRGGDPLDPKSWRKHPEPVFAPSSEVFGVGHASFTKSPDGKQDWIVYHGKLDTESGWNRAIFAQPFRWSEDGFPDFGRPLPPGMAITEPSGTLHRELSAGRREFAKFHTLDDWQYFGHHGLLRLQDQLLYLGASPDDSSSGYRTGEKVVLRDGCWSDVRVEATLRIVTGKRDAGILFRVEKPALGYDAQKGYFAGIIPGTDRVVLGSTDGKTWRHIADTEAPIEVGKDYLVTAVAEGDVISVELDGRRLLSVRDREHTAGRVGLRVVDTEAAFSTFRVSPLE